MCFLLANRQLPYFLLKKKKHFPFLCDSGVVIKGGGAGRIQTLISNSLVFFLFLFNRINSHAVDYCSLPKRKLVFSPKLTLYQIDTIRHRYCSYAFHFPIANLFFFKHF